MRRLFITLFVANVVLTLLSLALLPSEVAIHFGSGGFPDSRAPKYFGILFPLLFEIPLFLAMFFAPSLLAKLPAKYISLPNKDYWLREENKSLAMEKFAALMHEFGAVLFAFLLLAGILTIAANLSRPVRLNEPVFLAGLALFMGYTVYWCVKIFRCFKVPQE